MTKEELMRRAIKLSADSVRNGGGPFGAVIARNGEIIAEGSNGVTIYNDPTAHAEVSTIRKACQKLNTFDLSGCEIYTSCEPCPMCFGAIYWAHLDKIYYANDRKDAADIGFAGQKGEADQCQHVGHRVVTAALEFQNRGGILF